MIFKTQTEAEIFGHGIYASHFIKYVEDYYEFLLDLSKNKVPICCGSNIKVDDIYNEYTKSWETWKNAEYCGLVEFCREAVKLELKVI